MTAKHRLKLKRLASETAARMLGYIPDRHCANHECDVAVPPDHFWIDPFPDTPCAATVTVYCEHCLTMARAEAVLENGLWQIVGNVQRIEDPAERQAILNRADDARGVRQINAA